MKIAIKFGDNDFHSTFEGVLRIFLNAYTLDRLEHIKELNSKKEFLCNIINELSYGCYLLFQHSDGLNLDNIRKWLKITHDEILINNEVDDYLKDDSCVWNGETYILNTDLNYPNNNPVFTV